jgi:hypothetical protein
VPVVLRRYNKSQSIIDSEKTQQKERLEKEAGMKIKNFIMTSYFRGRLKAVVRKIQETQREENDDSRGPPPKRQKRGSYRQSQEARPVPQPHSPITSSRRKVNVGTPSHISQQEGPMRIGFETASSPDTGPLKSDPTVFYKLIGECYVHRMMNGEAVDYQNVEKLPRILFEIR